MIQTSIPSENASTDYPSRVLIVGIAGFAGLHLTKFALAQGVEVYGLDRITAKHQFSDFSSSPTTYACDLLDYPSMEEILAEIRPKVIFHLAAQASVKQSQNNPSATFMTNVIGTVNLLEAARKFDIPPRIILITSSEIYGIVTPDELPLTESSPLRPVNPYAVSKVTVHYLMGQYCSNYQIPVIEARAFNHVGPGQSLGFVLPDFCSQVAALTINPSERKIKVGDLRARRDFTDVRDIVRGYWLLGKHGIPGEVYNLCQGVSISMEHLLQRVIAASAVEVEIEVDPARLRPSPMPDIIGSYEKINRLCGWEPEIPFDTSVEDTYHYWRERLNDK